MIKCKLVTHRGARTVYYECKTCEKMTVRCFGEFAQREFQKRECWECKTEIPAILNLICNQADRIQYHLTSIIPNFISGFY